MAGLSEDKFPASTAADHTDLASLPRRFDAFAAETRDNFKMVVEKLLPTIDRIHTALDDIAYRLGHLERHQATQDKTLAAHAKELAELKAETLLLAARRRKRKSK